MGGTGNSLTGNAKTSSFIESSNNKRVGTYNKNKAYEDWRNISAINEEDL